MIVDGFEMTASHSEKDIYDGCIGLMNDLMGRFEDYLEFIGAPIPAENERFETGFYPTQIVERLFLWNTSHSGGTSQRLKCAELGVNPYEVVFFKDERTEDD